MKIPYMLYIIAMVVLFGILMSYVALPVFMIAAVGFIFSELKKGFFQRLRTTGFPMIIWRSPGLFVND